MPVVDPASSFIVGNAPQGASYAAPLMNFSPLSQLPAAYYQGQQAQRQLAMMNAFPNGVPTDANGNPDINAIVNTGARLGGLPYLQGLMPYMYGARIGQQAASDFGATSGNQPASMAPAATTSNPSATGPAGIRGPQAAAPVAQPQLSSAGADNQGADTVRSVAVESGIRDASAIPGLATRLGVDPDQPLSPQQVTQARALAGRLAQNITGNTASDVTGAGAPITPTSGASGAPAPPQTNAPQTAAPAAGIVPQVNPAAALVPSGYDPLAYANALRASATALRAKGDSYAALPNIGKGVAQGYYDQATAREKQADQITDALRTQGQALLTAGFQAQQPTELQKNIASGAQTRADVQKAQIAQSQKTYNGIQALASQYETDQKPYLDLSRSILNDPRMYTGTGANLSLDFNRVRAALGDPQAAVLQEALQKVTASNVLAQINQQRDQLMEAGGTAGRIFAQQVGLVEKAAPQLSTTLQGNRFLVEVASRIGNLNTQVRDMAIQYLQSGHQYLDPGFDRQVAEYLKANPMFTKEELANPALLGAPTAPSGLTATQDRLAWGQGMGLKNGDAFRAPNGSYMHWKAPAQQ